MKKSKYISKYDYIHFYTRQPALWFFTNNEIQSSLETLYYGLLGDINKKKKSKNIHEEDIEDTDFDEEGEYDSYEYYLELKEANENIDDKNPLICEGRIIDQKSKMFIELTYEEIPMVVDFDSIEYKNFSIEQIAEITEKLLKENDSVVLFQPVFIDGIKITKPDCFIKLDDYDYHLIETKGTSTCKFHHYLDLYFQHKVIESKSYLNNKNISYKLCLIKYEFLDKYDISFELTDCINYKKSVAIDAKVKELPNYIQVANDIKKGRSVEDLNIIGVHIDNLIRNDFCELNEIYLNSKSKIKKDKAGLTIETVNNVNKEFDKVIEMLLEDKNEKMKLDFDFITEVEPNSKEKSDFKNDDYLPMLRKIYPLLGYNIYEYSGNIADQSGPNIPYITKNMSIREIIKRNKNYDNYVELFSGFDELLINRDKVDSLLSKLNQKRVYFDFETVNTAIRVIDRSLPFTQVVTQCSIIKEDINKPETLKNQKCENLIIDPLKVDIEWYKEIVDKLYDGPEIDNDGNIQWKENDDSQYVSYVVYNKSFEATRLKEIKKYFKDELVYQVKIESIIDNMYDLADFFKISKGEYTFFIKELKGFYSIKKVLPLIAKFNNDIYKETQCLNYNDLEIKNGKECQSETTARFFKLINDKEWDELAKNLQTYCENDVRAMVAIERFINYILEKHMH